MTSKVARMVRCVDASNAPELEEGKIYKAIVGINGHHRLEGFSNTSYAQYHFETVGNEEEKNPAFGEEHNLGYGHYAKVFEDGSAVIYDDYNEFVGLNPNSVNKLLEILQKVKGGHQHD